jgi:type VI secretion system Hcp family effector
MSRLTLWLVSCLAMAGWAGPIYLQIEGIPGEVRAEHHEGWIEVNALASSIVASPGGEAAGRPDAPTTLSAEVTFLKSADKSSQKLAAALCRSDVLPKARFEFLTSDARAVRFYVVELEQVLVTSLRNRGTRSNARPRRVSLAFALATWTYTELAVSGQALADHQAYWDFLRQQGGSRSEPRTFRLRAAVRPGQPVGLRWTRNPVGATRFCAVRIAGPYVPAREIGASPTGEERFESLPAGREFSSFSLRELE